MKLHSMLLMLAGLVAVVAPAQDYKPRYGRPLPKIWMRMKYEGTLGSAPSNVVIRLWAKDKSVLRYDRTFTMTRNDVRRAFSLGEFHIPNIATKVTYYLEIKYTAFDGTKGRYFSVYRFHYPKKWDTAKNRRKAGYMGDFVFTFAKAKITRQDGRSH